MPGLPPSLRPNALEGLVSRRKKLYIRVSITRAQPPEAERARLLLASSTM